MSKKQGPVQKDNGEIPEEKQCSSSKEGWCTLESPGKGGCRGTQNQMERLEIMNIWSWHTVPGHGNLWGDGIQKRKRIEE